MLSRGRPGPRPRLAVITAVDDDPQRWLAIIQRGYPVLRKPITRPALIALVHWLLQRNDSAVATVAGKYGLTPRETELLAFAMAGVPPKQLADALQCADGTVRAYWQRILEKTGCATQRDVILLCASRRW